MGNKVSIIVVNWNSGPHLRRCIQSVVDDGGANVELIVVDNGSVDESSKTASTYASKGLLHLIRLRTNVGFARACNIGVAEGTGNYILFLNPDAALHRLALEKVTRFMDSVEAEDIAICGARLIGDVGTVEKHCARFPSLRTYLGLVLGLSKWFPRWFPPHFMVEFDHMSSREVDQVIGAFFFVRREVFEQLGGFDERFFVYFEELDFSLRARQAGWRTWYLAEATAYHKGGGTTERVKATRLFYSLRSRLLYGFKHFGRAEAWALVVLTCTIEPPVRMVREIAKLSLKGVGEVAQGSWRLWCGLPAIFRNRGGNGSLG